uniref:Disease resistance protein At4g27190-like leucine-rich repeats domain-containing protein n=1 Tax=Arundo donax TaxID=35708 RepID=A0A0A8ZY18_ARUDO
MDVQIMGTDAQVMKKDAIFQNSYFMTKHLTHSIDPERYLEINGTIGVPSDLDGILCHAVLISLRRLRMTTQFSDLNIRSMKAVRELWIGNCEELESLFMPEEVQALSAVGSLRKLWISNLENLSSFCKGVKDVTSFSCMKHLLLDCCPNLACLFPQVLRIPSLETLHIRFCDILERVFDSCLRRGQSSYVALAATVGAS